MHGYHPFAEDGGIYVAGVKAALDPTLFPHDRIFVSSTEHYSMFAPLMAAGVRMLHLPLTALLLAVYLAGIWLMLFAGWRLAQAISSSDRVQATATALLAAWITMPIAGTSLLLMDPYVTARTLSTPLCLLAIASIVRYQLNSSKRPLLEAAACLFLAGIFHPLMMMYGAALALCVLAAKQRSPRKQAMLFGTLLCMALVAGILLQHFGPVDTPAMAEAARSRYYWFLSRWQWYELLGLAGPLLVVAFAGWRIPPARTLCRGAIELGLIALIAALLFAQEGSAVHAAARLQPLRSFLLLYAVMAVLLGTVIAERFGARATWIFALFMAATMLFVQCKTFPNSAHIECPGRTEVSPWLAAFRWCKDNTPADALFAMDAHYITSAGEDGQVFRATAERSALPDYSKDGGQAAIHPVLAEAWWQGQQLQQGLNRIDDAERTRRLAPLGVTWVLLSADAVTGWNCPYKNAAVKVCSLTAAQR